MTKKSPYLYNLTPKRRAAWVKALRSDKYKQGYGSLRRSYGKAGTHYCCLGVLEQIGKFKSPDRSTLEFQRNRMQSSTIINDDGRPELTCVQNLSTAVQKELAIRNDQRETFKQIADWIEEHPKYFDKEFTGPLLEKDRWYS